MLFFKRRQERFTLFCQKTSDSHKKPKSKFPTLQTGASTQLYNHLNVAPHTVAQAHNYVITVAINNLIKMQEATSEHLPQLNNKKAINSLIHYSIYGLPTTKISQRSYQHEPLLLTKQRYQDYSYCPVQTVQYSQLE